ncbi:MAG: hypothetical protein ACRCSN_04755 [Dermatophilaceae bacterium]
MTVTDMPYGEAGATNAAQSAAPMSPPRPVMSPVPPPAAMPTGLDAPTARPDEPVTSGADAGPGPTSADIGLPQAGDDELKARFGPMLPTLVRMADAPYATSAYRMQVRQLIARITS